MAGILIHLPVYGVKAHFPFPGLGVKVGVFNGKFVENLPVGVAGKAFGDLAFGGGGDGAAPPSIGTPATKKYRMEFYLQAFNLLNHTNLGVFNGVLVSPYFGQPTSALPPRRMEVGLRLNF